MRMPAGEQFGEMISQWLVFHGMLLRSRSAI
jgi:hypothetical protein